MFENMTPENILARLLENAPTDVDKREGSIIFDALAPAAFELSQLYTAIDMFLTESNAATASRPYLILKGYERGIVPRAATYAIVKAVLLPHTLDLIGTRYLCDGLAYSVLSKNEDNSYMLSCETPGTEGNRYTGTLVPIEYVEGLTSAEITGLAIPGEDEEDTEVFRDRYFDTFTVDAFGGNKRDYIDKVESIDGVGACRVVPVWDGPGTVKVIITDGDMEPPSQDLIDNVQEIIDPDQEGNGTGWAPIGHVVTVAGAAELSVTVTGTFTFESGYTFSGTKSEMEAAVKVYLDELRQAWKTADTGLIVISKVVGALISVEGVSDVQSVKVNNSSSNLSYSGDLLPVLNEVVENE